MQIHKNVQKPKILKKNPPKHGTLGDIPSSTLSKKQITLKISLGQHNLIFEKKPVCLNL